ncbi:MAG: HEAT repeat domain-containing protein [Sphingorhabdus sp.]
MEERYYPKSDFLNCVIGEEVTFEGEFGRQNLQCLLSYVDDPEDSNRDWAALLISQLFEDGELDQAALKEALLKLATDGHFDTRSEAILGLASGGAPEALELVSSLLTEDSVGVSAVEAAAYVAHKSLLPALYELRDWWDVDAYWREKAIKACETGVAHD